MGCAMGPRGSWVKRPGLSSATDGPPQEGLNETKTNNHPFFVKYPRMFKIAQSYIALNKHNMFCSINSVPWLLR